jgi:predicted protein tyrosine phosphatase
VKRIPFVCSANVYRSPTAEGLLKDREGFDVRSAGTWAYVVNSVTAELLGWAGIIFVMEKSHKDEIVALSPKAADETVVLDILDIDRRNESELVNMMKGKLSEIRSQLLQGHRKDGTW